MVKPEDMDSYLDGVIGDLKRDLQDPSQWKKNTDYENQIGFSMREGETNGS